MISMTFLMEKMRYILFSITRDTASSWNEDYLQPNARLMIQGMTEDSTRRSSVCAGSTVAIHPQELDRTMCAEAGPDPGRNHSPRVHPEFDGDILDWLGSRWHSKPFGPWAVSHSMFEMYLEGFLRNHRRDNASADPTRYLICRQLQPLGNIMLTRGGSAVWFGTRDCPKEHLQDTSRTSEV